MYQACIFDLDGTLTDTLESITYSVNLTLSELFLSPITREQCKAFVGNGARVLMEEALKASGDTNLTLMDRAMEIYTRVFGEHCTYHVAPYEGIVELLHTLKEKGMKLAVLSNKPHHQTKDVVAAFFGEDVFDVVQGQVDGKKRKPDPEAVFGILEQLQVSPGACIYVGDSDVDMMTGKAAGALTVGVTWGFRSKDVLLQHGADCIIDTADALLEWIG